MNTEFYRQQDDDSRTQHKRARYYLNRVGNTKRFED